MVYVDCINIKQRKLAYEVVSHCYNQLLNEYNDIDILVTVKTNLDNAVDGWCQQNSSDDYEIEVERNLNDEYFIKTICHEMVHVKQGVTGELVNGTTWRGKEYSNEQPWEIEAYQLEKELFYSFLQNR